MRDFDGINKKDGMLSGIQFKTLIDEIQAKTLIIVLDPCHSGGFINPSGKIKGSEVNMKSGLNDSIGYPKP